MNRITAIIVISTALTAPAAIPLRWVVDVRHAQPATFETYQGETIELTALLHAAGKPLAAPSQYSLYWQTNGMGSTYWSAPCTPLGDGTNAMVAVWRPDYDVGARVYHCFIGAPSNIYHAAFQLRLRPSPGAHPNELPLPTPTIDCSIVTFLHPEDAPFSGGGGGITAQDATNIAESVVERDVPGWARAPEPPAITETDPTVPAWAKSAAPPQTGIDASTATNIAEAVVERHEREGGAAWNRTGYWVLDYCVVPDTVDASRVYYSTNDSFQVFSNAEAAVVYGTSAVMRQTPLDRYAPEISPVEGYQCLTPGGTMDGARLLASSGGVYRVSATALDGSVRYSDVLLTADRRDEKVVSTYVADVTQERNLTASWMKTICDYAQKVRTYSVGGREVEEWSTALAPFCLKGSGNSSPFAVSAHVLASAAHYPQYLRYTGTQTFADGGTNVTVRKTAWINLRDWALTHGWSEADIAAMPGAADIAFVTLADETPLPDACTPSFMTAAARDALFGSMAGVAAWQGSQYQDYANPVVMLSNIAWTSGDYRGRMRADVAASRERLGGGLVWVRTGDSGKPVWIYPDVPQLPVVVAHTSTTAGGADWCAALPIIKAFVESRGDTLKIWR